MICGWLNLQTQKPQMQKKHIQRVNCKVTHGFSTVQSVGDPALLRHQVYFVKYFTHTQTHACGRLVISGVMLGD